MNGELPTKKKVIPKDNEKHYTKWIHLNEEYQRIICITNECCRVVSLNVLSKHLHSRHRVDRETAKVVQTSVASLKWKDSSIATLPKNGSAPQPCLPLLEGLQCTGCCSFFSRSAENIEVHWEQLQHKGGTNGRMKHAFLQSWSPDSEIFWEVDITSPLNPADGIRQAEDKVAKLHSATGGVFEEDWVIVGPVIEVSCI